MLSISISLTVLTGSLASFLTAAILLLLKGTFQAAEKRQTSMREDIAEGVRFLWNQRILRTLAIMVAVMSACWRMRSSRVCSPSGSVCKRFLWAERW